MEEYTRSFVKNYNATGQVIKKLSNNFSFMIYCSYFCRQLIFHWIQHRLLFIFIVVQSHLDITSHYNLFFHLMMMKKNLLFHLHLQNVIDIIIIKQVIEIFILTIVVIHAFLDHLYYNIIFVIVDILSFMIRISTI
jgi:hypothetical protein